MDLNYWDWMKIGQDNGWILEVFCDTHDGPPLTDEEMQEWDDGGDPCSFHVKMLELN